MPTSTKVYQPTDYSKVNKPTFNTATKPGNAVNYNDVTSQINTAKNTQNQSQYQSPEWFSQATQSNYQALNPMRRQMNASINQNYNQSAQALSEMLAAKGLDRSGTGVNQMMGLEQGRNTALGQNNTNVLSQAMAQTIPQAQMGLSERNYLYGQQQDAVQNLTNLLSQQTAQQQWADEFNNNVKQQDYSNQLNQLAQQAAENQWFAELQQQAMNTLLGYGGTLAANTPNAPVPSGWSMTTGNLLDNLLDSII